MAQEMKNSQICYYVKCMAGIAFLFGFGYLPAIEPITPMGMRILGIFIGAIYLWSVAGVVWPALLAIVAYGMSGYVNMSAAISSGMGNTVVFQLILIIAMAGVAGPGRSPSPGPGRAGSGWLMGGRGEYISSYQETIPHA